MRARRRMPHGRCAAGALAIAIGAAACSATAGSPTASPACNTPGITPDQVKIGYVYSNSGPGSDTFSSARAGIDARLGLANDEGGVHGREVVYEWRDDESGAAGNVEATRDLVEFESVFGLVTSTAALAESMDYLSQQGVPVTGLASEPAWAVHDNMFSFKYSSSLETVSHYLRLSGANRVAIVTTAQSDTAAGAAAKLEGVMAGVGLASVATIPYAIVGDSADRVVREIAAADADALVGIMSPDGFANIVQAAKAGQVQFTVAVTLTGYDRRLLAKLGPALAGVSVPVLYLPFEVGGAPIERYLDAMTRYAPHTSPPEQQFAMEAYINTDLFLRGLELAGPCPTRQGFIDGLRSVVDYDAGGLIEPTDLGNNQGQPVLCHAFARINATGTQFDITSKRLCADGSSG